jgi:UDP-GlcNAc:undecaprenyl-phosphate GlcNAc-1-phosphate transferase
MQIPIQEILEFFVCMLFASLVSFPLLLLNNRLAPRLGLIDWPKARGLTEHQIPIIGHSIVLVSILYFSFAKLFFPISGWFLSTAVVIAIMGMLDDRQPLPAIDKMFVQIVFVVCLVLFDPNLRHGISEQFGPGATFLSIFFILGLMNAVNFIDGIDGLAGLVLLLGSAGFFAIAHANSSLQAFTIYSPVLIGSLIPFLYLNVVKRKGFLGNVGSYFFSFVLAYMHLSVPIEAHDSLSRFSISGLFFLIPISDAAMVLLSRLITRRSPFQADKGHLHHRLIQTSLPLRYILITFAIIDVTGLITGFALIHSGVMRKSIFPTITLLTHVCVVGYMIVFVEKATKRRVQSFFEHLDLGHSLYFLKYKVSKSDGKPVPAFMLNRICARINSEIRVTDVSYIEDPDVIFIGLKLHNETLRNIALRLEAVFNSEKLKVSLEVEKGEFVKIKNPGFSAQLKRVK